MIEDSTLAVRSCYSTWGETYFDKYYGPGAPYPPVHVDLVRRLLDSAEAKRVLDAGCGPASMLRQLTAPSRELYGFDLTPEMVAEAQRVMMALGMERQRIWEGSVLDPAAFRHGPFDAVVCAGVMPHIPEPDDARVFQNIRSALRPGGIAIVEARNALFSLFTMNRYSAETFFRDLISVDSLREQAGSESEALERGLAQLQGMFRTDVPPRRDYDEVLSRLHNPLMLRDLVAAQGFTEVRVLFYHFHCLPPLIGSLVPELFRRESVAMEANPEDWRGYVMASAFFIVGTRT